jgi:hypothetical protein
MPIPYSDLINNERRSIIYRDLLSTQEWAQKRHKIIRRDLQQCKFCSFYLYDLAEGTKRSLTPEEGLKLKKQKLLLALQSDTAKEKGWSLENMPAFLTHIKIPEETNVFINVHHTYYIKNNLPWNYPDEALITLCSFCHQEYHDNKENIVPVYTDETKQKQVPKKTCIICNGSGYRSEFSYYLNGICFHCNGMGYFEIL